MLWGSVNPLKGSPPLFLFKRFDTWYVHHSHQMVHVAALQPKSILTQALPRWPERGSYQHITLSALNVSWPNGLTWRKLPPHTSASTSSTKPHCVCLCVCACTLRQMGGNCLLTIQQNRSIVKIVWMRCDQIKVGALMEKDDVKSWQRWLQCECKTKHTSANDEICY